MNVICDTNIFIHYFNGDLATQTEVNNIGLENILMPSIAKMELLRGMENKNKLEWMLSRIKYFNIIHLSDEVSQKATELIEQYHLSHGLTIPDALIAAMAIVYEIPLFTYNVKDFRFLPAINLH